MTVNYGPMPHVSTWATTPKTTSATLVICGFVKSVTCLANPPASSHQTPTQSSVNRTTLTSQMSHMTTPSPNPDHLHVLQLNFNSLKSTTKVAELNLLITNHNPDVIIGCETKLDNTHATYSIFPADYTVFRRDRNKHGGGVLITIRSLLNPTPEPALDSHPNQIWCSVNTASGKKLVIGSAHIFWYTVEWWPPWPRHQRHLPWHHQRQVFDHNITLWAHPAPDHHHKTRFQLLSRLGFH